MRCAVWNCTSNNSKACQLSFFRFPRDKALQREWVKFCGRLGIFMKNSQKPNFSLIGPVDPELWVCTDAKICDGKSRSHGPILYICNTSRVLGIDRSENRKNNRVPKFLHSFLLLLQYAFKCVFCFIRNSSSKLFQAKIGTQFCWFLKII